MDRTLAIVKSILMDLWKRQNRGWRDRSEPSQQAWQTYQQLINRGQVGLTREALETLISGKRGDGARSFGTAGTRFIFLPPIERDEGFVPVLYLPGDFASWAADKREARVCLALYGWYDPTGGRSRLVALGFRFETPHDAHRADVGTEEPGRHAYHHVQLIRCIDGHELDNCPEWLPESLPALPCAAACPISLLLCMYLSLYGRRQFRRFITSMGCLPGKHLEPFRAILAR